MDSCGITQNDIDNMPFGIAMPFREALLLVKSNPPGASINNKSTGLNGIQWPSSCYELIGRMDLAFTGDPRDRAIKKPMHLHHQRTRTNRK